MKTDIGSILKFMVRAGAMWLLPMSILIGLYVILDPMLVLRWHEDMMPEGFLPNKGNVTVKNFEHYNPEKHYDSFLVGSSITINLWIEEWKKYLPEDAVPYHFDTSRMTIEDTADVLDYIVENSDVKNILVVFPPEIMTWRPFISVPYILPPEIKSSSSSKIDSHYTLYNYWFKLHTLYGVLMTRLFKEEPAGKEFAAFSKDINYYDPIINEEIASEKNKLLDTYSSDFILSDPNWKYGLDGGDIHFIEPQIDDSQKIVYNRIFRTLEENGINYNIIMAPQRNREQINPADDAFLKTLFGDKYINLSYDQIYLSRNPYLWYDFIHYRPNAGRELLERIYNYNADE